MKHRKFVSLAIAAALVLSVAPSLMADSTPDGAVIYKAKCAMCHGADGKGKTSLVNDDAQKKNDAELASIIANGKAPKMPAYKAKLSEAEIKAVVVTIRDLGKKK